MIGSIRNASIRFLILRNEKRELLIRIWYLANTTQRKSRVPYLPSAWIDAHNQDQGIGKFLERDFSSIQTHSFTNVSIATTQGAFPVIIMQPGMGPVIPDYTVFAEIWRAMDILSLVSMKPIHPISSFFRTGASFHALDRERSQIVQMLLLPIKMRIELKRFGQMMFFL